MVWTSYALMTVFDLIILGASAYSLYIIFRNRNFLTPTTNRLNYAIAVSGLVFMTVFYLADLIAMWVLPLFMPSEDAHSIMESLYINFSWPVIAASMLCLLVGMRGVLKDMFWQSIELREKNEDLRRKNKFLAEIRSGIVSETGEAFFQGLAEHFCKALDADVALVGKLSDGGDEKIKTLGFYVDGHAKAPFIYSLKGAPCENVIRSGECAYAANVQKLFPEDSVLREMNIEGYVGAPLINSSGKAIGLLAVLFRRPCEDMETAVSLLRIFATRAVGEMERKNAEDDIKERLVSESILNEISTQFIQMTGESFNEELEKALGLLGRQAQADRCFFLEFSEDKTRFKVTHMWTAEGIVLDDVVMTLTLSEAMTWLTDQMARGQMMIFSNPDTDLPPEAVAEREYCKYAGVRSTVMIPMAVSGAPLAAIGLDSITRERSWTDTEIRRLRLAGHVIANALQRMRAEAVIRKSEERYRGFIENSQEGIFRLEIAQPLPMNISVDEQVAWLIKNTLIAECNDVWARMRGHESRCDLEGKFIASLFEHDHERFVGILRAWIENNYRYNQTLVEEVLRSGDHKWFRSVIAGQIENGFVVRVWGTQEDVTEHRLMEEESKRFQSLLLAAIEHSPAGFAITDKSGRIRMVNGSALAVRDADPDSLVDIPIDLFSENWQTYYLNGTPWASEDLPLALAVTEGKISLNVEMVIRRPDGKERLVLVNAAPAFADNGEILAGVCVFLDITDLKKAQSDLLESERLMQENQLRLLTISHREQQRFGQDLHDSLGQQLTGIGLKLRTLEGQLVKQHSELVRDTGMIRQAVHDAIQITRDMSRELFPRLVTEHGLVVALEELITNMKGRFALALSFEASGGLPHFDPETATHLYRIVQEAVNNAVRHGRATQVDVTLQHVEGKVCLTVKDDGCGFDLEQPDSRGMGLYIMKARSEIMKARLAIESVPGEGTTVSCVIQDPVEKDPGGDASHE